MTGGHANKTFKNKGFLGASRREALSLADY